MFEEKNYENLLQEVLDNAPDDIDTRPGSIFYDSISGIIIKIAEFYTDLELIFKLSRLDTAKDEYLDALASQFGIKRHSATKAQYFAKITGVTPDDGERFFYNGLYFVVKSLINGTRYFEAEEAGTEYNGILYGASITPVDTISGLTSAKFGGVLSYAMEAENDDSLRIRLYNKISGSGENGNKQHYRLWCESVDGVAKARIFPLWNGANTVKALLIGSDGLPCQNAAVQAVQNYVDPNTKGTIVQKDGHIYNCGDGLGEGAASIGAHFTAAAAFAYPVDISAEVTLAAGYSISDAKSSIENVVKAYCKEIALSAGDEESAVIYYNKISSAITASVSEIEDFKNLTIDGGTSNLTVSPEYVPKVGILTIEEAETD